MARIGRAPARNSERLGRSPAISSMMLGLVLATGTAPAAPSAPWVFAADGSVGVQVTSAGAAAASVATGLVDSGGRANYSLGGATDRPLHTTLLPSSPLGPSTCSPNGNGTLTESTNGSVSLAQPWACTAPHPATKAMVSLAVTVTDTYSPGKIPMYYYDRPFCLRPC